MKTRVWSQFSWNNFKFHISENENMKHKISLEELIAPYQNRFVILFSENATTKLELSCTEGKVYVDMIHDLRAPKQTLPQHPLYRRQDIMKF